MHFLGNALLMLEKEDMEDKLLRQVEVFFKVWAGRGSILEYLGIHSEDGMLMREGMLLGKGLMGQ